MDDDDDRAEQRREGDRDRDEAIRATAEQNRALARMSEQDVRGRLLGAFDRFIDMGVAVHLIAVRVRTATEYRLAVYPDGAESLKVEPVREIAAEFRLDFDIERDDSLGQAGWAIVLYPLA